MTYKEFQTATAKIQNEKYSGDVFTAVDFGLKRADFVQDKLQQLVAIAEKTHSATARKKQAAWLREIEKSKVARKRFELIKLEDDLKSLSGNQY